MGYWKSKVLPKIKKVFELRITGRKASASEACKTFDGSKEAINKEIEEKKTELQPKVVETYEATSAELKTLVKERKEEGLKKQAVEVHKFLEELVKIEFPGSKAVCEASTNHGVTNISGPVFFIFEKVSAFLPVEEKARELPEEMKTEEAPKEAAKTEETSGGKGKDIVEEEKREETKTEIKTEEKKEEVKSEQKTEEKIEEAKSEEKKLEEKVEEKKSDEKKPEDQTDEKKKEKVEEKKEIPVAPAAMAEEKPAEPKKP